MCRKLPSGSPAENKFSSHSVARDTGCRVAYQTRNGCPPEHSYLVDNVIPVPRCLELLGQKLVQLFAHFDNASGHGLNVLLPLRKQLRVVEDQRDLHTEE